MGIKPATDIFQSRIVGIFQSTRQHKPHSYIDDKFHGVGGDFDKHLSILSEIFKCLMEAGMQVNLEEGKLCAKIVELFGFLPTKTGHWPTCKQIKEIL